MSLHELSDAELVARAVRNARPHGPGEFCRWVVMMETFGLGATYSVDLCRQYGLNPEDKLNGRRCEGCNP